MTAIEKFAFLLEAFHLRRGQTIDSYDENLLERLSCSPKQLGRDLREMERCYDNIVEIKNGKKLGYKLVTPVEIIKESFSNNTNLGMLFTMAKEAMPELMDEIDELSSKEKKPYRFYNMPYEDIELLENNATFKSLKNAVKRHEYRVLHFRDGATIKDAKCIKIIFLDGNWYIAYVLKERLKIGRLNFIEKVTYSNKSTFSQISIQEPLDFLNTLQNSMTLYGVVPQIAVIRATPRVGKYFQEGMKKFLKSQEFIESLADGGVRFSLHYTQPMEILPFLHKWLPDLTIESPNSLRETYKEGLQKAIQRSDEFKP